MKNSQNGQASFETILGRLVTHNERLDRELEALLNRIGLTKEALNLADEWVRRCPPERLARAMRDIEARLDHRGDQDWEHLKRPSTAQLSSSFGSRLLKV